MKEQSEFLKNVNLMMEKHLYLNQYNELLESDVEPDAFEYTFQLVLLGRFMECMRPAFKKALKKECDYLMGTIREVKAEIESESEVV